jgi:anti-sigma factor RsiW
MSGARPDWATLNAYVDGELHPGEAARVARAVASDRTVADATATIARLKAAVHETLEPGTCALPPAPPRRFARHALAACIAGLAVATALLWYPFASEEAPPAWLGAAWAAHDSWAGLHASGTPNPDADAGQVLVAFNRLGADAYLPDLTAAKLVLNWVKPVRLGERQANAMHLGYRGTRGCQVSLFILSSGQDLPRVITAFGSGARRSYAWRNPSHGYLLMADGMDRARFDLIARTLQEATRTRAPFGPEVRSALRASREASTACVG